jgi:DNA repair exonuclease SbcCD ATPase subunit
VEKENQDTLDIVFKVDGSERDYNLLSGGQKMYIALSMKMGLSAVIQKRLGVDIKFLELDEVDQSLDKAGVDAFASVMKSWQSKWKIFVVTHNETLKNFFNHAILVEKIKAGSTAKVVTQW